MPDASEQILAGRQPLEDMLGVELLSDLIWDDETKRWYLEVEIEVDVDGSGEVPPKTRWCVRVSPHYPQGDVDILPASEGGLAETFHHQLNNSVVGRKDAASRRWRPGKICVDTDTAALNRHGADPSEPRSAGARLSWHLERAKLWIHAAATDTLAKSGEPFELPDYRPISGTTILFNENEESLASWNATEHTWGWVSFAPVNAKTAATTLFSAPSGESLYAPAWGERVARTEPLDSGLWMRVDEPLVSEPWQAPMSWGAIEDCFDGQTKTPLAIVARNADKLRDGRSHVMLVGYPIPAVIGGPAVRMHWVALRLPVLANKGARIKGFRNSEEGLWSYDRNRRFRPNSPAFWGPTENADDSELTSRGSLNSTWCKARVLVIGCGALGSAVSELLVRGGVRDLTLCDADDFEAGNLVRHTLTSADLGENKAEALATRLNAASPNASVEAIAAAFPPSGNSNIDRAARATVVVDCSANDDVLHHLSAFEFNSPPAVFHISFGSRAKRLFLYGHAPRPSLPDKYLDWIDPWLAVERSESSDATEIRPSAGCWHPAFPARADHVWLLSAAATNWMNNALETADFKCSSVFERTDALELVQVSLEDE